MSSKEAIMQVLNAQGVVILPSESVYELATLPTGNYKERLANIKKYPDGHTVVPTYAFLSLQQMYEYILDAPDIISLINHILIPGPLTILIRSNHNSFHEKELYVTFPSHEAFRDILSETQSPLALSSANYHGMPSLTDSLSILHFFSNTEYLDGSKCEYGIENTCIDARKPKKLKLTRPGIISQKDIQSLIPSDYNITKIVTHHYQHHQPFIGQNRGKATSCVYIGTTESLKNCEFLHTNNIVNLGSQTNPLRIIRNVYRELLALSQSSTSVVFLPFDHSHSHLLEAALYTIDKFVIPSEIPQSLYHRSLWQTFDLTN